MRRVATMTPPGDVGATVGVNVGVRVGGIGLWVRVGLAVGGRGVSLGGIGLAVAVGGGWVGVGGMGVLLGGNGLGVSVADPPKLTLTALQAIPAVSRTLARRSG